MDIDVELFADLLRENPEREAEEVLADYHRKKKLLKRIAQERELRRQKREQQYGRCKCGGLKAFVGTRYNPAMGCETNLLQCDQCYEVSDSKL